MIETSFVPVYDKRGNTIFYDIYINNKWVGSKSTLKQCEERVKFLTANS
jgi:hypothetical protein